MKKQIFILGLFAIGITQHSIAQTFTTPTALNDVFPVTAPATSLFSGTESASSYSTSVSYYGGCTAYLTGWSGGAAMGNGFSWRLTDPYNPLTIYDQGIIPYTNVMDMEVGVVNYRGDAMFVVAYYDIGVGHKMDIYRLVGVPGGIAPALTSTINLSTATSYGRISLDCYDTKVALCWENASSNTMEVAGIIPNPSLPLVGPTISIPVAGAAPGVYYKSPDIAIGGQGNFVNFVSYPNAISAPVGGGTAWMNIHELSLDWNDLFAGSLSSLSLNDINPVPAPSSIRIRPVIDAPDEDNTNTWAYTYDQDDYSINVRIGGMGSTTIINDGSMGNMPLIGRYRSYNPSLAYSPDAKRIYVAWHTSELAGFYNSYVAASIANDGSSMLNAMDYMELPNARTPFPVPKPSVALSKNNNPATSFLYAGFYDEDNLHHAYHIWGNPVFSPNPAKPATVAFKATTVSPNPFTDELKVHISSAEDHKIQLQLTDISGKTVKQSIYNVHKGDNELMLTALNELSAGMYFITVWNDGQQLDKIKVIRK